MSRFSGFEETQGREPTQGILGMKIGLLGFFIQTGSFQKQAPRNQLPRGEVGCSGQKLARQGIDGVLWI